jgi:hypothetical protein
MIHTSVSRLPQPFHDLVALALAGDALQTCAEDSNRVGSLTDRLGAEVMKQAVYQAIKTAGTVQCIEKRISVHVRNNDIAFTLTRCVYENAVASVLNAYTAPVVNKLREEGYADPWQVWGGIGLACADTCSWTEREMACILASGYRRPWGYRILGSRNTRMTMHALPPCTQQPLMVSGSFAVVCVLLLSDAHDRPDLKSALAVYGVVVNHEPGECHVSIDVSTNDQVVVRTSAGVCVTSTARWMTGSSHDEWLAHMGELGALRAVGHDIHKALLCHDGVSVPPDVLKMYEEVLIARLDPGQSQV